MAAGRAVHEISIRSAKTVIENIDSEKYACLPIAIMNDGRWLSPAESLTFYRQETRGKRLETEEPHQELLSPVSRLLSRDVLDVVFPVLNGTYGEDGTIQGLFEMADLAYIGCGVSI